jgi:pimeloyl-ACP methyl ester carboxylesterase
MLEAQTNAFDQSIEVTFNQCDSRQSCPVHDARATYDRVAARLAAQPMTTASGTAFGPTDLAVSAISTAYDPARSDLFLSGLADADRGDPNALDGLAGRYRDAVSSYATYAAVVCTDLPHPQGAGAYQAFAARLAARSPRFGAAIANEMLPCAFWPVPTTGQPGPATVSGGPPVLVVGTTGDPATPYASAQAVAIQLPEAVLLTDQGAGHTSGGRSACVDATVRRYLIALTLPPTGALCTDGS